MRNCCSSQLNKIAKVYLIFIINIVLSWHVVMWINVNLVQYLWINVTYYNWYRDQCWSWHTIRLPSTLPIGFDIWMNVTYHNWSRDVSPQKQSNFFSPPWLRLSYFGLIVHNVYDIELKQMKLTRFDNISEVGSVIIHNNNYNFSISLSHLYPFSLINTWMFAYVSKKQWIMKKIHSLFSFFCCEYL